MVISRFVFVHRFFITISIFLANNGILCHRLGFSSMSGIWWVGCLHVNMDKFDDLCNAISLIWKGRQGELHSCLHLINVPYTYIYFPCMFLEMDLWWAQMWKIYVSRNCWLFYKKNMDPFCLRVDAVPNYMLITWDPRVTISTILHTRLSMSGEDFRILGQDPSVFKTNRLHVVIFKFTLLNWGLFYATL